MTAEAETAPTCSSGSVTGTGSGSGRGAGRGGLSTALSSALGSGPAPESSPCLCQGPTRAPPAPTVGAPRAAAPTPARTEVEAQAPPQHQPHMQAEANKQYRSYQKPDQDQPLDSDQSVDVFRVGPGLGPRHPPPGGPPASTPFPSPLESPSPGRCVPLPLPPLTIPLPPPLPVPVISPVTTTYDPECARMEAWLDDHPDFVFDYFVRKATRQMVDAWLVSHAAVAPGPAPAPAPAPAPGYTPGQGQAVAGVACSASSLVPHPVGSATADIPGSPTLAGATGTCTGTGRSTPTHGVAGSASASGTTTPVRKISAHEFERSGLLKPIVNTIDGTPTFLSLGLGMGQPAEGHGQVCAPGPAGGVGGGGCGGSCGIAPLGALGLARPLRRSRQELKQLDEKELIFELLKDICNDLEVRSLCHKILQNVSMLLHADRGSLFLVQESVLVSKLFDVCSKSTLEEMEKKEEIHIPLGTGIVGYVAESGEVVNIPDAYKDDRFNREIDASTGYKTRSLLCMPIKDVNGDVIGVAQVINKQGDSCFTANDEKVFTSYLQFCGIGLRNAQLYERSQLEIKRNQVLLDLASMIFQEQSTLEHMVHRILSHMHSLIQCQRLQVLLVHQASKGSFSRLYDYQENDTSVSEICVIETGKRSSCEDSHFPVNIGITGYVATTGETVNIPDAYEDERFDPSVDEGKSFKHKTILCMAIKNSSSQIIGVFQLVNKFDDLPFTKNDENFVEAFAIFCGMGIHNTHMYEKAVVAMAKHNVTLDVLSYHASASLEDARKLQGQVVPSAISFNLHNLLFDDEDMAGDATLKASLRMFLDLDFVERFHIDYEVLCRWLLSVKKNYRSVSYHNWTHAFNVAQTMFAIVTTTEWWKAIGDIECLALLMACLCHDLDHRGTNNSFQVKASSPLAQLYSTSTMEHHHFDQCIMILNSPGNQILANLSPEEYSQVIKALEEAILATDLAVYFKNQAEFFKLVRDCTYDWREEKHREVLRGMLMTVCDLAAITKPWEVEKRVADMVTKEFFQQGDIERNELHLVPMDIMDREKEDSIPLMQVGFVDTVCRPIYEAFSLLSDKLMPLYEGVLSNREIWLQIAEEKTPVEVEDYMKKNNYVSVLDRTDGPKP